MIYMYTFYFLCLEKQEEARERQLLMLEKYVLFSPFKIVLKQMWSACPTNTIILLKKNETFTAKIVASRPRRFAWDFVLLCDTGYYSEIIPKLH